MRINTNVNALNTYRLLSQTNSSVSSSMSKLSSGFRINRAADDAAGLGIANQLRSNTRSLTQASRNAEQANSLLQIAEGATSGVQRMLERMKELATQAGSETLDQAGRDRIQAEFGALREEITRTVNTTSFQGAKLVDGSYGEAVGTLKAGDATAAGNISAVGASAVAGEYSFSVNKTTGAVTLSQGSTVIGTKTLADGSYASGKFSFAFGATGITVDVAAESASDIQSVVDTLDGKTFDVSNSGAASVGTKTGDLNDTTKFSAVSVATGAAGGAYTFQYDNNSNVVTLVKDGVATATTVDLDTAITPAGAGPYTSAAQNIVIGDLTLSVAAGQYGDPAQDGVRDLVGAALAAASVQVNEAPAVTAGSIDGNFERSNFLVGSSGAYEADDLVSLKAIDLSTKTLGIDAEDLSTATGARTALTALDGAIEKVNQALGQIGAFQNRIENAMDNLKTSIQNFTAAESVIRDVDMAEEMTKFSKNQILAQAGTAMLAQANQSQQGILQLLRG